MKRRIKQLGVFLTIVLLILANYGLPIYTLVVQAEELPIELSYQIISRYYKTARVTGIVDNRIPADHRVVIPDTVQISGTTYNVTEVGNNAFQDKQLTEVVLGNNLTSIGDYAFANNQINTLSLPDSITSIRKAAFRDNRLSTLSLNKVIYIGNQAFANNQLQTLDLNEVQTINSEAFIHNQLSKVTIGASVSTYGSRVFGYNQRFVEIVTTNSRIQTEIIPNGYGQVVNPVNVTVEFLKEDGTKITEDQTIGNDFYNYNGIVLMNQANTYQPPNLAGYQPKEKTITYTPDSTNYVLKVYYTQATGPTIQPKSAAPITLEQDKQLNREQILAYFNIQDYTGKDISDKAQVSPDSIDATGRNEGEKVQVNITVEDDYGKITSQSFDIAVSRGIMYFPLGKIRLDGGDEPENTWMLGDFEYGNIIEYNTEVIYGFSASGKRKLAAQLAKVTASNPTLANGIQVIFPHINPTYLVPVKYLSFKVDRRSIDVGNKIVKLNDYLSETTNKGNIEYIHSMNVSTNICVFDETIFKSLKEIGNLGLTISSSVERIVNPSLESIIEVTGSGSDILFRFNGSASIRQISFPNLKSLTYPISDHRFSYNPYSFGDFSKLEVLSENASLKLQTENYVLYLPNLKSISSAAFSSDINTSRADGKIVIQTPNAEKFVSQGNYLIVKPEGIPPETINETEFVADDFVYDQTDASKVLGFSANGYIKFLTIQNSEAQEKVLRFPDNVKSLGFEAFKAIDLRNITKIDGNQIEYVENEVFESNKNFYGDLVFPKLSTVGHNFFTGSGRIKQAEFPLLSTSGQEMFRSKYFLQETLSFENLQTIDSEPRWEFYGKNLYLPKAEIKENTLKNLQTRNTGTRIFISEKFSRYFNQMWASTNAYYGLYRLYNPAEVTIQYLNQQGAAIYPEEQTYLDAFGQEFKAKDAPPDKQLVGAKILRLDQTGNVVETINATDDELSAGVIKGPDDQPAIVDAINSANYYGGVPKFPESLHFKDKRIVQFIYGTPGSEEQPEIPSGAIEGVLLKQYNQKDLRTGEPNFNQYHIGDFMYTSVYLDLTGFEDEKGLPKGSTIELRFNPSKIDNVRIGTGLDRSVQKVTADLSKGIVRITLNELYGGSQLEIPLEWKFKQFVTPQNYQLDIASSLVVNRVGNIQRLEGNTIQLFGEYYRPSMSKSFQSVFPADFTPEENWNKRMAYFGKQEMIPNIDGEYIYRVGKNQEQAVTFTYEIEGLERDIAKARIVDTLPTYSYVDDDGTVKERTAVFDASLNPGWQLSGDGKTVSIEAPTKTNVYYEGNKRYLRIYSADLPQLKLTFPQIQLRKNIVNHAAMTLYPVNAASGEVIDRLEASTSLYQPAEGKKIPEGEIHFYKDNLGLPHRMNYTTYFYDTQKDRESILPFYVQTYALDKTITFKKAVITDYQLDNRLYYYGVAIPDDSSVNQVANLSVKVIAYGSSTENIGTDEKTALLNPKQDPVLQVTNLEVAAKKEVVFDPTIAKQIRYIQIVFPEDYVVDQNLLRFIVNTKLKEPNQSQYTSQDGSSRNRYPNDALLSGEAINKATGKAASSRLKAFSAIGQPYQRKWDGIEGNFLWHDQDAIYVWQLQPKIRLTKNQEVELPVNAQAVVPGDKIRYKLAVAPENMGENISSALPYIDAKMQNFKLVDLLPLGVQVDLSSIRLNANFAQQLGAKWQYVENYEDTGHQALVFTADKVQWGTVSQIADFDVEVTNEVRATGETIDSGSIENKAYLTFDNREEILPSGTKASPTNGIDADNWLISSVSTPFMKPKELFARKFIRETEGGIDRPWQTGVIETNPGAHFEYKLAINNDTESSRTGVDVVDVLPYPNDLSIQELTIGSGNQPPRESEFRNFLDTNKPIKVYLVNDSQRTDMTDQFDLSYDYGTEYTALDGRTLDTVINARSWKNSPRVDSQEVLKAIRIKMKAGVALPANQSLEIVIPMLAPMDEALRGKVAYNTFVHMNNTVLRYLEPNRVGNRIKTKRGQIQFTKQAKAGQKAEASLSSLAGAIFSLSNTEGTITRQVTSDSNGKVLFDDLPIDQTYTIQEIQAPNGYEKSTETMTITPEDFTAAEHTNYIVTIEGTQHFINVEQITGELSLEKVYRASNADTPLANIGFRLIGTDINDAEKEIYRKTFYTDAEGKATVTQLPEGNYRLTEMASADDQTGFEATIDQSFTIDATHRQIIYTGDNKLVNDRTRLIIQKIGVKTPAELASLADLDDIGKRKLSDFTFKIKEYGTDGNELTVTTDATGQYRLVDNLKLDTIYQITESEIPASHPEYLQNTKVYYFMIKADGKLYEVPNPSEAEILKPFKQNVLNFPNQPKRLQGELIIEKKDDQNQPIVGALFGLYQNDQLIQTAQSKLDDITGKATATFTDLAPGVYILRELKAPSGYFADTKDWLFMVPETYQATEDAKISWHSSPDILTYRYTKEIINHPIQLQVYKGEKLLSNVSKAIAQEAVSKNPNLIMEEVGENLAYANVYLPVANAAFNLYVKEGQAWNYLATYYSTADGSIDFKNYPFDSSKVYKLVETQAPAGYILDDQPLYLDFTQLAYRMPNDVIQLYKNNRSIKGKITISKYSKDGRVLANMRFGLYDTKGNLLATTKTGDTGFASFENLVNGDYIVKELPNPGYKLNRTEYRVTINQDVKHLQVTYENEPLEKISLQVNKKWIADSTKLANISSVNVYLLQPTFTDEGQPVYRYYDGTTGRYITKENNWLLSITNLPAIDDPLGRNYRFTEYQPLAAYQAMIGGYSQYIFDESNRLLSELPKVGNYPDYSILDMYTRGNVTDGFIITNVLEQVVSVGDYVFIDRNQNHLQDENEPGLAGVTVQIIKANGDNPTYYDESGSLVTQPYTVMTNEKGYYAFHNLKYDATTPENNKYKITFQLTETQKQRYGFVEQHAAAGSLTSPKDSDADPTTGETQVFELKMNPDKTVNPNGDYLDDPTIDAGVYEKPAFATVSLGDQVFIDTNDNNLQDEQDQVLSGVTVRLLTENGENPYRLVNDQFDNSQALTATTDINGRYHFDQLKPGRYIVQFELTPAQAQLYEYVTPNIDENQTDTLDSDAIVTEDSKIARTQIIDLTASMPPPDTATAPNPLGLTNPTVDAGVRAKKNQLVSLGDYVFIDLDHNQVQSPDDQPLADVIVRVVKADGTNPMYLANGMYVQQPLSTRTDANGHYQFKQLVPGEYKVIFELNDTQRHYYRFVTANRLENDALDSDAIVRVASTPYIAETDVVNVSGTPPADNADAPNPLHLTNPTLDAGVEVFADGELVSLGDYVFVDTDGTNTQTASDQPLPNVRVEVKTEEGDYPTYRKDGQMIKASYVTFTDANGRYQFTDLIPGRYKVYFTLTQDQKQMYTFIAPNIGGDKTKDSDAVVIDDLHPEVAVTSGDLVMSNQSIRNRADNPLQVDNPDFDAGVHLNANLVSVGDKVFIDMDDSNTQTLGDGVLPGVIVQIVTKEGNDPTYLQAGKLVTQPYITKTNEDGLYAFTNLIPGEYKIIFTLTDKQKETFHYVTPEVGQDIAIDSNAIIKDNTEGKIAETRVFNLTADPIVRNGDNNPLHVDNPTIDAGVAMEPTIPQAGSMQLILWYFTGGGMFLLGLMLVLRRKKAMVAIRPEGAITLIDQPNESMLGTENTGVVTQTHPVTNLEICVAPVEYPIIRHKLHLTKCIQSALVYLKLLRHIGLKEWLFKTGMKQPLISSKVVIAKPPD